MKKLLFSLSCALLSGAAANAQIKYHDISPDTTISTWDAFVIYLPAQSPGQLVIWHHPTPEVVVQTSGNWEVLFNGTLPAKLNPDDSIGAGSGTWQAASYDALNSGGTGNWQTAAADKYLAFRFHNTGGYNYGWLKMTVAAGGASFTVKEYAYNMQADKTIKAGQTTNTSVNNPLLDNLQIAAAGRTLRLLYPDNTIRYHVAITDMTGRVVQQTQLLVNQSLFLDDLSAGTYMARVSVDRYSKMFKISLQ